jgi:hypothetical protein
MPNQGKSKRARRSRAGKRSPIKGVGVSDRNYRLGENLLAPPVSRSLVPIGLPTVFKTQHRYVESIVLNAATGSLGTYVYRTNSLFDPNLTGTGHQPYGFDQFKAYYATYLVTASQITVECVVGTASSLVGVTCSTDSALAVLTTADTLSEPGRGQCGLVAPAVAARTFQSKWALKDIPHADPADYSALVGASPANSDFFTIYHQDAAGLAASPVLYFTACIVYDCEWRDPITVASS